jgi:hypothetical protein
MTFWVSKFPRVATFLKNFFHKKKRNHNRFFRFFFSPLLSLKKMSELKQTIIKPAAHFHSKTFSTEDVSKMFYDSNRKRLYQFSSLHETFFLPDKLEFVSVSAPESSLFSFLFPDDLHVPLIPTLLQKEAVLQSMYLVLLKKINTSRTFCSKLLIQNMHVLSRACEVAGWIAEYSTGQLCTDTKMVEKDLTYLYRLHDFTFEDCVFHDLFFLFKTLHQHHTVHVTLRQCCLHSVPSTIQISELEPNRSKLKVWCLEKTHMSVDAFCSLLTNMITQCPFLIFCSLQSLFLYPKSLEQRNQCLQTSYWTTLASQFASFCVSNNVLLSMVPTDFSSPYQDEILPLTLNNLNKPWTPTCFTSSSSFVNFAALSTTLRALSQSNTVDVNFQIQDYQNYFSQSVFNVFLQELKEQISQTQKKANLFADVVLKPFSTSFTSYCSTSFSSSLCRPSPSSRTTSTATKTLRVQPYHRKTKTKKPSSRPSTSPSPPPLTFSSLDEYELSARF